MTAKRFELTKSDIKDFRIYDYEKEDAYFIDCDNHTGNCLVDLLNELHEENTMLKERRHEDINELSVIAMKYKALENENEQLKFENNELKCALALDEVEYIIANGKKIDIPPYYEFEQRYDSVMHRRGYDGYD